MLGNQNLEMEIDYTEQKVKVYQIKEFVDNM